MSAAPIRRSVLFVPGSRPELVEKAVATGADAVCLDLEDAVPSDGKAEARRAAVRLLREGALLRADAARHPEIIVRINTPRSTIGEADLLALGEAPAGPDALLVPKVDSVEDVARVGDRLEAAHPGTPILALVETARGLAAVEEIATAGAGVGPAGVTGLSALVFGGVDLSTELGAAPGWDALLYARSRIVHAAALAGIDAIDTPFMDVSDPDGLAAEAEAVARLGFTGKLAIHPDQVPVIQRAFSPDEEEVAEARKIIDAYERNGGGVLLVDGRLVERPVIEAARRVVAVARAAEAAGDEPGGERG